MKYCPTLEAPTSLSVDEQAQLDKGLTVISGVGYSMLAGAVYTAFSEHITAAMPQTGAFNKFSYLHGTELEVFDEIGRGLLGSIGELIGYKLRTKPCDLVETSGFILYPPNDPGTGKHGDRFWGDSYIRLTLPLLGEGNFWSVTTGARRSQVGDLLIQDLGKGPQHEADNIGSPDPRVVAFWDLPADRVVDVTNH